HCLFEIRLVVLESETPQLYASFVNITERKEIEAKLLKQNKQLSEIAYFQSHHLRSPIASILGLISLFDFNTPNQPLNAEIMAKMKEATEKFDGVIREMMSRTENV